MAAKWFPFIGTIFLFIWFSNIIGYLPLPTNTEHTVDIFGVAGADASRSTRRRPTSRCRSCSPLMVWVSYHVEGIRAKGFVKLPQGLDPGRRRGPGAHPDLLHRGHLALRPPRQPERPTLRQHPRRPPADPLHGRRAGRAAQPRRLRLGHPRARHRRHGRRLLPLRGRPGRHAAGLHLRHPDRDLPRRRRRPRSTKGAIAVDLVRHHPDRPGRRSRRSTAARPARRSRSASAPAWGPSAPASASASSSARSSSR